MEGLLLVGTVQALFASLLILTKKNRNRADYVLTFWLILIAIQLIANMIGVKHARFEYPEMLAMRSIPFTYGPFMFIYALLLIAERPRFKRKYWLHFIPFFVSVLFFLILLANIEVITKVDESFRGGELSIFHLLYAIAIIISIIIYTVLVNKKIRFHKQNILNHFSSESDKNNLVWLQTIALCFSVGYLFAVVSRFLNISLNIEEPMISSDAYPAVGLTFFSFALSFFGFNQSAIFTSRRFEMLKEMRRRHREQQQQILKKESKYERSSLKKENAQKYIDAIEEFMIREKPYLDNDFNIDNLSKTLDIPKYHITQVINEYLKKNFYTLVNEYRVEEVKQMLASEKCKNYTLMAIAYDCGFSSKSAFNTVFKKVTGQTPSEYKKSIEN